MRKYFIVLVGDKRKLTITITIFPDVKDTCLVVFHVKTTLGNLELSFVSNKQSCTFKQAVKDLAVFEIQALLEMSLPQEGADQPDNRKSTNDEENITADRISSENKIIISFPPISLISRHNLNAPLQTFNAINIFYDDKANLGGFFERPCNRPNFAVKSVEQESSIFLSRTAFRHLQRLPEVTEVVKFRDRETLFILHDIVKRNILMFGKITFR